MVAFALRSEPKRAPKKGGNKGATGCGLWAGAGAGAVGCGLGQGKMQVYYVVEKPSRSYAEAVYLSKSTQCIDLLR